ncbi:uncharacterized protein LOC110473331 [Lonchura striata]
MLSEAETFYSNIPIGYSRNIVRLLGLDKSTLIFLQKGTPEECGKDPCYCHLDCHLLKPWNRGSSEEVTQDPQNHNQDCCTGSKKADQSSGWAKKFLKQGQDVGLHWLEQSSQAWWTSEQRGVSEMPPGKSDSFTAR